VKAAAKRASRQRRKEFVGIAHRDIWLAAVC